ncbi:MAG: hypothetical protein O9264_06340 [Leptospira sp.]|nr:hypothetical protein [Leptospira sp.]
MKKLNSSYFSILILLLGMYLGVTIIYKFVENTNRSRTKVFALNREFDHQLYKINERAAFLVLKSNTISIVKYKETIFPFCFLCGNFEVDGTIVNVVEFAKDNWYYTKYTSPFYEAYNIKTDEFFDVAEQDEVSTQFLENLSEFKSKQLGFATQDELSLNFVKSNFEKLPTLNESCLIFNVAFLIVISFYLLGGFIYFIFKRA